jgi:head-tail adaptor
MKAGTLDRRVSILRLADPVDDGFTVAQEFEPLGERRCRVVYQTGKEAVEAAGKDGMAAIRFHVRYDSLTRTITEEDVLDYEGARFAIVAPPIELGRREGLELIAQSQGAV